MKKPSDCYEGMSDKVLGEGWLLSDSDGTMKMNDPTTAEWVCIKTRRISEFAPGDWSLLRQLVEGE